MTASPRSKTTRLKNAKLGLPHMEPEGLLKWAEIVSRSECYLEYGSGASTAYAAKLSNIKNIISVESDPAWAGVVVANISARRRRKVSLINVDIGPTSKWGAPVDKSFIHNFHLYMTSPWKKAEELDVIPNTILIDGRFRVACFLYSLLLCQERAIILFDDYFDRNYYHAVEEFCPVASRAGRMAIFRPRKTYHLARLVEQIANYSIQPQ